MKQTKSDWFDIHDKSGQLYELEIFGVTNHSKHCMRLLREKLEIEVFHLDDLNSIIYRYELKWIIHNNVHIPMTRQIILDCSEQLHAEGLGITLPWTERQKQIQQEKARQNKN